MLFRKRSKRSLPPIRRDHGSSDTAGLYRIEYDMMLKGSISSRKGVPVRQFGVYVDGVVRLVTSGDCVDRETYEALLAVAAIKGDPPETRNATDPGSTKPPPRVIDDSATE